MSELNNFVAGLVERVNEFALDKNESLTEKEMKKLIRLVYLMNKTVATDDSSKDFADSIKF